MEEMIGRVTNCKEEVQAVFLNMRSVHLSVRVYFDKYFKLQVLVYGEILIPLIV